jgi:hypothetical protein
VNLKNYTGEQRLRERIATLQEYRRMGISSFKEGVEYEKLKQERVCCKIILFLLTKDIT